MNKSTNIFSVTGETIISGKSTTTNSEGTTQDIPFKATANVLKYVKSEDKEVLDTLNAIHKTFVKNNKKQKPVTVNPFNSLLIEMQDIKLKYLQKLVDLSEKEWSINNNSIKQTYELIKTTNDILMYNILGFLQNLATKQLQVQLPKEFYTKIDTITNIQSAEATRGQEVRIADKTDISSIINSLASVLETGSDKNAKRFDIKNVKVLSKALSAIQSTLSEFATGLNDINADSSSIQSLTSLLSWVSGVLEETKTTQRKKFFLFGDTISVEHATFTEKSVKRFDKAFTKLLDVFKDNLGKLNNLEIDSEKVKELSELFESASSVFKYIDESSVKQAFKAKLYTIMLGMVTKKMNKIFNEVTKANVDSEKIDNFVVYSDKLVEVVNNLISANTSIKNTIASVLGYKTITSSLLSTYAAISEKTFEYKKIEAFVSNTSLLSAVYSRVSQLKANILMPTVFAKITDVISETFEKIQKIDIKDNVVKKFISTTDSLLNLYNKLINIKLNLFKPEALDWMISGMQKTISNAISAIQKQKFERAVVDVYDKEVSHIFKMYEKLLNYNITLPEVIWRFSGINTFTKSVKGVFTKIRKANIDVKQNALFISEFKNVITEYQRISNRKISNKKLAFISFVIGRFTEKSLETLKMISESKPQRNPIETFTGNIRFLATEYENISEAKISSLKLFKLSGVLNLFTWSMIHVLKKIDKSKNINVSKYTTSVSQLSDLYEYVSLAKVSYKALGKFTLATSAFTWAVLSTLNQINDNKTKSKSITTYTTAVSQLSDLYEYISLQKISYKALTAFSLTVGLFTSRILKVLSSIKASNQDEKSTIVFVNNVSKLISLVDKIPAKSGRRMTGFATGLSALVLAVSLTKAASIDTKFISSLSKFLDTVDSKRIKSSASGMKQLAGGVAMLGLALTAFAALSPAILVGALALKATSFIIGTVTSKKQTKNLALFTASLAMFGVAIWAFGEVVTGESMLKTVGGLVILYGALQLFGGNGFKFGKWNIKPTRKGIWKEVAGAAAAIATLGLAIHYGWSQVSAEEAAAAAAGIGGIGLAMRYWDTLVGGGGAKMGPQIALASVGIGALGLSMKAWRGVSISDVGAAILGVGGIGLAMNLWRVGNPKVGLTMAAVGLGVGAIGLGMQAWKGVDASTATTAVLGITGMAIPTMLLGTIGTSALLGASSMVVIGAGVAAIGFGMKQFENVSGEQMLKTGLFITTLAAEAALLGAIAPVALAGAAIFPILGSGIALIGLGLSNVYNTKPETVDTVSYAIKTIATTFGGNLWAILKAVPASAAFIPVAGAALLIAPLLKTLGSTKIDNANLLSNIDSIDLFVERITDVLDRNKKKLKSAFVGSFALLNLGNMLTKLATGIQSIANLQFPEYEVRNGKAVLKSVRAFTKKDFDNVGTGIASIIDSLAGPLEAVGSKKDTFKIAGKEYTNPFGNKVKSGIDALSKIGNILSPIADGIKTLGVDYNKPELFDSFGNGIASILNAISKPLEAIGANTPTVTIMGMTVTNPFGSNDVKKGIKAMSGIGEILAPINDALKMFIPKNDKDKEQIENGLAIFSKNILNIINAIAEPFKEIGKGTPTIDLFGITVTNPFGSNDVKKGIKAMSGLNAVFEPVFGALDKFVSDDSGNSFMDKIGRFKTAFPEIINTISESVTNASKLDDLDFDLGWFSKVCDKLTSGINKLFDVGKDKFEFYKTTYVQTITSLLTFQKYSKQLDDVDIDLKWFEKAISRISLGISKYTAINDIDLFNSKFKTSIEQILFVQEKLSESKRLKGSFEWIGDLSSKLTAIDVAKLIKFDKHLNSLYNVIGDDIKLQKANKQLKITNTQMTSIRKSLNGMNLQALIHFDHAITKLAEIARNQSIAALVEAIENLVKEIANVSHNQEIANTNTSNFFNQLAPVAQQNATPLAPVAPQVVNNNKVEEEKKPEPQTITSDDIYNAIVQALRSVGLTPEKMAAYMR